MKLTEKIPSLVNAPKTWLTPVKTTFGQSTGVQILSGVLVLQLAVAGGLLWKSNSVADFAPATQLVNVDPSAVDEIIIDDGEEQVTLTYVDDRWQMDDEYKTIADVEKIDQLLSDMTALKPGLPVASTTGSHEQLEVAENSFQRRVTLKSGDVIAADLYMGTSPGFRKSHIRPIDQDQVYAARLNTFDVPAKQDDWLDKDLLAIENIVGVQAEGIELSLVGEQWSVVSPQDQSDTHEVDQQGIAALMSQFDTLRVNGFATPLEADETAEVTAVSDVSVDVATAGDESAQQSETEELITHSITVVQNDTPVTLMLSRKGSNATIERSDVKGLFALPVATYEALTPETIQQLIVEKSAESPVDAKLPQG